MLLIRRLLASASALALLLTFSIDTAEAAEGGVTVAGTIALPPVTQRKAAPKRGKAFVKRAKNPLRPPNGLDPRLEMVVVLDGGPVDDSDRKPRSSRYNIIGENFKSDILPVIVGGKVEIKNLGRRSPRLYSKFSEEFIPSDPINRKGVRVTKPVAEAFTPIDIRDHDASHFIAHIVAFEHAYFAVLDHNGKFEIKGVPAGTWQVKVWYRDAWVKNLPKTSVTISAKRPPKAFRISLPVKLTTATKGK